MVRYNYFSSRYSELRSDRVEWEVSFGVYVILLFFCFDGGIELGVFIFFLRFVFSFTEEIIVKAEFNVFKFRVILEKEWRRFLRV